MEYSQREAQEILTGKVKEYLEKNRVDHETAYKQVLIDNPELAKAYTKGHVGSKKRYNAAVTKQEASEEITQKIETAMLTYNITHDRARDFVMHDPENAELVRIYVFGG